MTIILIVFASMCLIEARFAKADQLYDDCMNIENTIAVQGIFVLLVFFRHFVQYVSLRGPYDAFARTLNSSMGQLLVTPFLFYSGFGIMESISAKGLKYTYALPKKILRILLHFDLAILLYLILQLYCGKTFPIKKVLLSLIGWESIGNSNWYIFVILSLYFLTFVSFGIFNKSRFLSLILITVFSVVLIHIFFLYKPAYWYNTLLCFPLGMWFSFLRRPVISQINKFPMELRKPQYLYLLSLIIVFILFCFANNKLPYDDRYSIMRSCFFVLFIVLLSMKIRINNAFVQYLGRHVFSIYILQRLPMILLDSRGTLSYRPYMSFVLSFMTTLFIAAVFDYFVSVMDGYIIGGKKATTKT